MAGEGMAAARGAEALTRSRRPPDTGRQFIGIRLTYPGYFGPIFSPFLTLQYSYLFKVQTKPNYSLGRLFSESSTGCWALLDGFTAVAVLPSKQEELSEKFQNL